MAIKGKKPRRRRVARQPATRIAPQVASAEDVAESKEQLHPGENYAVDVAPDRIDVNPKRLDRENPVCNLPSDSDETSPDR